MEIFDVHRRDIFDFDSYMDLKKPGFGGPSSGKLLRDDKGNKINKDAKLQGYQHTAERHKAFSHPVFDPTYKAMSNDLVYKQEKKKPLNYGDPSLTGIPVVNMGDYKYTNEAMSENRTLSFSDFLNEAKKVNSEECQECKDKKNSKKGLKKVLKKGKKKMNESHFDDEFFHDYNKSFGLNPNDEEEEEQEEREDLFPEEEEESGDKDDKYTGSEEAYYDYVRSEDGPEEEEEEEEAEEPIDDYEKPEESEEDWEEKGPSKKDIQEIEALLKGFESDDEDEDDAEERYKY